MGAPIAELCAYSEHESMADCEAPRAHLLTGRMAAYLGFGVDGTRYLAASEGCRPSRRDRVAAAVEAELPLVG